MDDFWQGAMMKEPIFYGSESAYSFLYRDFFAEKHAPDHDWLERVMGFSSSVLANQICDLLHLINDAPSFSIWLAEEVIAWHWVDSPKPAFEPLFFLLGHASSPKRNISELASLAFFLAAEGFASCRTRTRKNRNLGPLS